MKRWLKWVILLLVVAVIAGLVLRTLTLRKTEQAAVAAAAAVPTVLELNASDLVVVQQQDLQRTLSISGGLKAVNSAFVKAKVAAELKALNVREGDTVKAGQVIGQLDTSEFDLRLRQVDQTALAAKAQVDMAQRTLTNNRALVTQGFISPTALETSLSMEASAQASYLAAVAAVDLARKAKGDALLVSPLSGVVSQRLVQPGERVAVDAKVVEVVDLSRIELEAAVAPEDVVNVRVGQVASVSLDGRSQPYAATVSRINPSTQAGSRAVLVYLAVQSPGDGALRQGLFARGSINLEKQTALLVPVTAVRIDQARPYVLAVVDGKVSQRSVVLGARGDMTVDGRVEAAVELSADSVKAGTTVLRGTVGNMRDGTAVKMVQSVAPSVVQKTAVKATVKTEAVETSASQAAQAR
jgi:RND family efflux transporter MFP subunit